jgi:two-component system, LytTR family, response regulator
MDRLRCLIVDDEPLASERLRALLAEAEVEMDVIGEAGSGQAAVELVRKAAPDIVFLDVQMPGLNGFDVVEALKPPRPQVVFVTAFDEYALRAFEVHAVDYLTKPVRLQRLNETLRLLRDREEVVRRARALDALADAHRQQPLRRVIAQAGRKLRVIPLEEVRWFEARDKLVLAHAGEGAYPVSFTLDDLGERLDPAQFIRLHRSHIVNAGAIRELVPWFSGTYAVLLHDGTRLEVARRRVAEVKARLGAG